MKLSVVGMCEKRGKLSTRKNMLATPVALLPHSKSVRKLVTTHCVPG